MIVNGTDVTVKGIDNISEQEKEIVGFIDYEPTRYRDPGWADMMERITLTIREQ